MATNSKLRDIISKYLPYREGDLVVLFFRRGDGYPKNLQFGIDYKVSTIENDFLYIQCMSVNGLNWMPPVKINQIYVIPKDAYRDLKIKEILS
jgi:hypothetical protein